MAVTSNITMIPLFSRLAVTTNGAALSKSTLDLSVPAFQPALLQAAGIFVVGLTENVAAADLEWNIAFFSGFDRDHQPATPTDIAGTAFNSTSAQGQRSADYNTLTSFLADSRLQVWWRNQAGVTGPKSGLLSGLLGIRWST